MIARLYVVMPFHLIIPTETEFKLYPYDDAGYEVCMLPSLHSEKLLSHDSADEVTIGEKKAYLKGYLPARKAL